MPFAVFVMMIVAIIAFATVVAVMYYGTQEGDVTPHAATDSTAVSIWATRAEDKQKQYDDAVQAHAPAPEATDAAPAPEATSTESAAGKTTGKTVSDLSDEEKEAKRAAALARRQARAAMKAQKEAEEA